MFIAPELSGFAVAKARVNSQPLFPYIDYSECYEVIQFIYNCLKSLYLDSVGMTYQYSNH